MDVYSPELVLMKIVGVLLGALGMQYALLVVQSSHPVLNNPNQQIMKKGSGLAHVLRFRLMDILLRIIM